MLVLWSLCSEGERSEAGLGGMIVLRQRRGGCGGWVQAFNSSAAGERLP